MKKNLMKMTNYAVSLLLLLALHGPLSLTAPAQDYEYDEQHWWNPGDWLDETPNNWEGTDTEDWLDDDYYDTYTGEDYPDDYDVGGTNDWYADEYWNSDWDDTGLGDRDYSEYGDSAWDYDDHYWGDDWDYEG